MTQTPASSYRLIEQDLILAPGIRPSAGLLASDATAEGVLLTGVTGYLGGHLCKQLLERGTGPVFCLVRGPLADRRVAERLALLGDVPDLGRVHAVTGDFSQPRLGLSPEIYESLAATVGTVFHCGASTDLTASYPHTRLPNVVGVEHLLRFATHRRLKHLHHVSTMSIFLRARQYGIDQVDERTPLVLDYAGTGGYPRSKCVAEQLVRQADVRGIPASVYRPAFLPGDHYTTQPRGNRDLFNVIIGSIAQIGAVPAEGHIPAFPVESAARAIAALSERPGRTLEDRTYNLVDPSPLTWRVVGEALNLLGHRTRTVAPAEWPDRVAAHRTTGPVRALAVLLGHLGVPPHEVPDFSSRNISALAGAGALPPPMGARDLARIAEPILTKPALPSTI